MTTNDEHTIELPEMRTVADEPASGAPVPDDASLPRLDATTPDDPGKWIEMPQRVPLWPQAKHIRERFSYNGKRCRSIDEPIAAWPKDVEHLTKIEGFSESAPAKAKE